MLMFETREQNTLRIDNKAGGEYVLLYIPYFHGILYNKHTIEGRVLEDEMGSYSEGMNVFAKFFCEELVYSDSVHLCICLSGIVKALLKVKFFLRNRY